MAISVAQFYDKTFKPLALRSRSDRTRQLYSTTIKNFATYLNREPQLDDFTDETVGGYLAWFRQLGRSPYTVNKERANLLALWRFAARKRLVDKWPDVPPEIEPKRIPIAWTREELVQLFQSLKTIRGRVGGVLAAEWWISLHLVAWDTGERITALMLAKWEHVDLPRGFILVPAEARKGKRADRLYRIAPDTVEALKRITLPPRQLVWPWDMHPTYLWKRYGTLLKRAGLASDSKSKFHRIRRSVATYAEQAGLNATELLGHSSRKVTLKYIDPRIVGVKHAVDVLFRPIPH